MEFGDDERTKSDYPIWSSHSYDKSKQNSAQVYQIANQVYILS
jgi:hypothetical protein